MKDALTIEKLIKIKKSIKEKEKMDENNSLSYLDFLLDDTDLD